MGKQESLSKRTVAKFLLGFRGKGKGKVFVALTTCYEAAACGLVLTCCGNVQKIGRIEKTTQCMRPTSTTILFETDQSHIITLRWA